MSCHQCRSRKENKTDRRGFLRTALAAGLACLCPTVEEPQEESYAFEKLASTNPLMEKEAIDAINDFTRAKIREDGYMLEFFAYETRGPTVGFIPARLLRASF